MARKGKDILLSKKGEKVTILDVTALSDITDYFILVTGTSPPHIKALAEELQVLLKKEDVRCYRHAGTPESGWVVVDYLDMVVHILSSKCREYYSLEKLWGDAPRIDA